MATRRPWLLPAALGLMLSQTVTGAAALVPPPGFYAGVEKESKTVRPCPPPPAPFTADLEFPSKYEGSGSARDKLNAEANQRYRQKTEPIRMMERDLSSMVGKYLKSGRPELLECAVQWLTTWSRVGALKGDARNHTGKAARKWALASLASAYVRLKFSAAQPLRAYPRQAREIERWFNELGHRVIEDWKGQPLAKVNNHEYWAAWGVMAASVASNDRKLFDWAVQEFRTAAGQIDSEGYLPNELKRDTRALAYHNYSLGPLLMVAAFAGANGEDLRGEGDAALQRLARRVLAGLDNPRIFEDKTGKAQVLDDLSSPSKMAWLEPYCRLYPCEAAAAKRLQQSRPLRTYRLGGNVTDLFASGRGRSHSSPSDAARDEWADDDQQEP